MANSALGPGPRSHAGVPHLEDRGGIGGGGPMGLHAGTSATGRGAAAEAKAGGGGGGTGICLAAAPPACTPRTDTLPTLSMLTWRAGRTGERLRGGAAAGARRFDRGAGWRDGSAAGGPRPAVQITSRAAGGAALCTGLESAARTSAPGSAGGRAGEWRRRPPPRRPQQTATAGRAARWAHRLRWRPYRGTGCCRRCPAQSAAGRGRGSRRRVSQE